MHRRPCFFLLCAALLISACSTSVPGIESERVQTALDSLATTALTFAVDRYGAIAATQRPSDGYPRSADSSGTLNSVPISDWTSGFFPGILWQLADYEDDPQFRNWAHEWTMPLAEIVEGHYDHDLGFQFMSSFGLGLQISREETYRTHLLDAARRLAERFDPAVGAIKSWDWSSEWEYPVIADNMMNLEILLWGAANGGEPAWRDWAITHARTTMRDHVRQDGGSFHVVDYDSTSGQVRERVTHQGAADASTWARGQAWLIYGFTMMYRETALPEFSETARRLADYFIDHLPPDGVPVWDFQAPNAPPAPRDASAAAIATSALLELSTLLPQEDGRSYRRAAELTLATLAGPHYVARESKSPMLLLHAVGNYPAGGEIDVSLIYGDFYFIEALRRYLDLRTTGSLRSGL